MAGRLQANVNLSIHPSDGLLLNGTLEALNPRWHGAMADSLSANVQMRGSTMNIQDIEIAKGDGRGYGDIWLTWADLPPKASKFESCFRISRLPISGGLKAADQGDLPIDGTGSGWVRIWGPYDALQLQGDGIAENATAYQVSIPAASADFRMDLATNRISLPEFRIAESIGALSLAEDAPSGLLALKGRPSNWIRMVPECLVGQFRRTLDSSLLAIPGPRIQANVDGKVEGGWDNSYGPMSLPNCEMKFSRARIFAGDQSAENIEGMIQSNRGVMEGWIGRGGAAQILKLTAFNRPGHTWGPPAPSAWTHRPLIHPDSPRASAMIGGRRAPGVEISPPRGSLKGSIGKAV